MMATFNLLVKRAKGAEFIITDFIATRLNEKQFNRLKEANMSILGDYVFIPYNETDFTWWGRVNKYLTKRKLYHHQCFHIDWWGNVERVL